MRKPTMYEIACDFDLWGTYVDPGANMSKKEFEDMSVEERVAMQREMFPYDAADEDAADEDA